MPCKALAVHPRTFTIAGYRDFLIPLLPVQVFSVDNTGGQRALRHRLESLESENAKLRLENKTLRRGVVPCTTCNIEAGRYL